MSLSIGRGTRLLVTDAFGSQLERIALGGPRRGGDFSVIWVCRPEEWEQAKLENRDPEGVPWPSDDVRAREVQAV